MIQEKIIRATYYENRNVQEKHKTSGSNYKETVKKTESDARELADVNVGAAECNKREEENVAVDAAKPRHLGTAASDVFVSLRQNLLYRYEKVVAHHARDDLLHQPTTQIIIMIIIIIIKIIVVIIVFVVVF